MNAIVPSVDAPERNQAGARTVIERPREPVPPPHPEARPGGSPGKPIKPPAFTVGLLQASIQEVAFANYFLNQYETELRSFCPADLASPTAHHEPETPAQRALRLLDLLDRIERRVHDDLGVVTSALQGLVVSGLATLEENIHTARRVLADDIITPNLTVLKLEQDGGVKSPFLHLDADGIIEWILQDTTQDPATMHQAERTLRGSVAVQDLRENVLCMRRRLEDPATRQALDSATAHLRETENAWGLHSPPTTESGPCGLSLRILSFLNRELSHRAERLAILRPWIAAYQVANPALHESLQDALPAICREHSSASNGADPETLFAPTSLLGRLAATHGFLPVAQTLRERVAQWLDRGEGPDHRSGTVHGLEALPGVITRFLRRRIQDTLRGDRGLRESLTHGALALSNRAIAERIAAVSVRLGYVENPAQHRILTAAEAIENVSETLAKVESGLRHSGAGAEASHHRQPVITLLESLMEQFRKQETFVDALELETLVDDALDYLRRRGALTDFMTQRQEFIRQGWTARSQQRRMETPLKSGVPTLMELGAIDAELGEAFDILQTDVETFLTEDGPPATQALRTLARIDREIRETLERAPITIVHRLMDAKDSPVIAGLPRILDRLRSLGQPHDGRIETLERLIAELRQLTAQAPVFVGSPTTDSALQLCKLAGVSALELADWSDPSGSPLPLSSCLPQDSWGSAPPKPDGA